MGNESTDIGSVLEDDVADSSNSVLNKLKEAFGLGDPQYSGEAPASVYVSVVINYFLAIVSFIALAVVIYGFYMMFFSDQEEGFSKAKKILTGAAIAIVII